MSSGSAQFNGGPGTSTWKVYRLPGLIEVYSGAGPIPPEVLEPGVTYRMVHINNIGSSEVEFTTPSDSGHHVYDSLGG